MTDASKRSPQNRKRVAVLISGRGSNMMSLVEAARAPDYPAEIISVISNRPQAAGLAWAEKQGIPTAAIDHTKFESRAHFDAALDERLIADNPDIIACAGFMRLMTPAFVTKWQDRMINIHPSLLPLFKGLHTHQRAIDAGMLISGCTVHAVRPEMDEGPILGQAAVPILPGDTAETLSQRVLTAEHKLYPQVLALLASHQISIADGKVKFPEQLNQNQVLFSPTIR